ncbi:uncharacterized protein LOC105837647 [Monomorium pharaonis]|uniref:uncharacterized protein LOC105837647 n=1 Tax=Monomorium pharaonis TaxID=307658 RepID=UPI00063EED17|nr:uncharacterized protein LOC105837647 [Monomorium pharaonis]
MGISFISLVVVTMVPIITGSFGCAVGKRSTTGDSIAIENIDYPDYSSPKHSNPVMPKRAALLLDQFLLALQKAVDHGKSSTGSTSYKQVVSKSPTHRFLAANSEIFPIVDDQMMDLKRRGHKNDPWLCYFNALACYKKK